MRRSYRLQEAGLEELTFFPACTMQESAASPQLRSIVHAGKNRQAGQARLDASASASGS